MNNVGVRQRVVTSAVNRFKTDMMGVIGDEGEMDYAEYQRRLVIWKYDLTITETVAFNKAIGYTSPIN